jgi:hypothetical protein
MSTDDPNPTTTTTPAAAPAPSKMSRAAEPARGEALPWYSPHSGPFRLLMIVLVIGAIVGWIYWNSGDRPREENRVSHKVGYSIVRPSDWKPKFQTQPNETYRDGITLEPEKWISLEPSIWARRLLWPPDTKELREKGFVEGDFQGHKAWLSQQKPRFRIARTARFPVGSDWYEVGVSLPGLEGAKVDDWWEYALTFRPAPVRSTTQPATARPAATGGT